MLPHSSQVQGHAVVGGEREPALAGYPLREAALRVGGREWRITSVEDQDALVARVTTDDELARFPYGLMLWPSALGLAEELAEQAHLVSGKRVIELGAGAGLAGLVAASLGAQVLLTDFHPDALRLAQHNALRNGLVGAEVGSLDWRDPSQVSRFDVVLASDVLYDGALHQALRHLLPRLLAPQGTVILADPMRPQALGFIDGLEQAGWRVEMDGRHVPWAGEVREVALFRMAPGGEQPPPEARAGAVPKGG